MPNYYLRFQSYILMVKYVLCNPPEKKFITRYCFLMVPVGTTISRFLSRPYIFWAQIKRSVPMWHFDIVFVIVFVPDNEFKPLSPICWKATTSWVRNATFYCILLNFLLYSFFVILFTNSRKKNDSKIPFFAFAFESLFGKSWWRKWQTLVKDFTNL